MSSGEIHPKPLLICSGGTTTRCAANGHITLDLRHHYTKIHYNPKEKTIKIGGGVNMRVLIEELAKYSRSFPIGLSGQPGMGYILTGGISPISRSHGLAIDHIKKIKGIWGSGENFELFRPSSDSNKDDLFKWKGLCGAAPFLAIITELTVQTEKQFPLSIWQASLSPQELAECIAQSEKWPNEASLHWIWGDFIEILIIIERRNEISSSEIMKIINKLPGSERFLQTNILGLHELPEFKLPLLKSTYNKQMHSETIGIIGPRWGKNCLKNINFISRLMSNRPNNQCYIAAQQLGGVASLENPKNTCFMHRNSMWKPWITSTWEAGNETEYKEAIVWQEKLWKGLQYNCPGVHLAQIHSHLQWHEEELNRAYKEFLPDLRKLKLICDPNSILPCL